jgi:N-acetylmuramoyl-L-alanine amidase
VPNYYLPPEKYVRRKSTDTLVIHCSQTNRTQDIGVDTIRQWHVKENGWLDVGYHLVICRDGTVETGRPLWAVGAHVGGHNATSIGVCLVGGSDTHGREERNFTPSQWQSLKTVVKVLLQAYLITDVKGHREFPGVSKYCPSFDVAQWLKDNKREL